MSDLLPCPFCGSTDLGYDNTDDQGVVSCNDCSAKGPVIYNSAEDDWNQRAIPEQERRSNDMKITGAGQAEVKSSDIVKSPEAERAYAKLKEWKDSRAGDDLLAEAVELLAESKNAIAGLSMTLDASEIDLLNRIYDLQEKINDR